MKEHIKKISGGLICDNPKCDWSDSSIEFKDMKKYINVKCPKCSENILTEKDYENVQLLLSVADLVNGLSKGELEQIMGKKLKKSENPVTVRFNTHKEISIEEIRKSE